MVKVKLMNVIKLNRNARTDRFYIVIKKRSLVTDNVQRNISRYVQLYKYGVYNDIYNSGILLFSSIIISVVWVSVSYIDLT